MAEAVRKYIKEKAAKLPHFFERLTMIAVTVDLQDELHQIVEFQVSAEHKHDFVARETNADVKAAVDLCLDKVERQIRRYKEKVQDHRRDPSVGEVAGAAPEEAG